MSNPVPQPGSHYYNFIQPQQPQPPIDPQLQGLYLPPPQFPPLTPMSDSSVESPVPSSSKGKRPASAEDVAGRKKSKMDANSGDEEQTEKEKAKATRGSRACTVCRRLKMKCVGAENGPPCKRCSAGGHECIFEESNRGKRSTKKSEALQRSLNQMEQKLEVVLRSLNNPALASLTDLPHDSSSSPSSSPRVAHHLSPSLNPHSSASNASTPHPSNLRPPTFRVPTSPKLDGIPDSTLNPLGLLADTSLAHRREREHVGSGVTDEESLRQFAGRQYAPDPNPEDGMDVGLANDRYFKPGPMNILPLRRLYIERQIQPEMLTFVTKEEVIDLFKIYFQNMNTQSPMLDPEWHTPSLVCSRSPFLLTAICAVSSKFYPARDDLHQKLNKIAKKLAFSVPEQGFKSVEIVQAYVILSLWGTGPVERFEQERTWILLGLAIRVATDINLHRKISYATEENEDSKAVNLEIRNRERTWLMLFCLDRSFSAQMGKPHSIKEDFIIRNARQWWQHPHALPMDIGLAAYVDYQRTLSRSLDFIYSGVQRPSGLQTDCDYLLVIKTMESELVRWTEEWAFHAKTSHGDRVVEYRGLIAQFYFHYANLVINSFGLQNALERSPTDIAHFFGRTHASAITCARIVKDELVPRGYMRYCTDSHFVLFSYALLTLLKLIRTEFQPFIQNEQAILGLVSEMADLFDSIAVNPYHTPALYSSFLRALVTSKTVQTNPGTPAEPSQHPSREGDSGDGGGSAPEMPGMTNPAVGGPFNSYSGEMGQTQVQDISTFPPTYAAATDQNDYGMFTMDNILGDGFWDSVLIPGYNNAFEGLSGGFVYGAGGTGFITPKRTSPAQSGANSPVRGGGTFAEGHLNGPFGV